MCGIVGFLQSSRFDANWASRMAEALSHRGPDDAGVWSDASVGLAIGHRRLSIIDLSAAGHQPMVSPCKRWVLAFNGEIYNHAEMRAELESAGTHCEWRGQSDTETLLAAVRHWGITAALQRAVGMFAIALWDAAEKKLVLARDRMGEKPLYYGWQGPTLLFGSELKALRVHPAFRAEVNKNVIPLFLRHGYVPGPHSIYHGIYKVQPGTCVVIDARTRETSVPTPYWSLREAAAAGEHARFSGREEEGIAELKQRLGDAVRLQMLADVPLGAFLSGGIDSSLVVATMQSLSSRPVKTFTIGFDDDAFNEAKYAQDVARHLGTEHSELYVTASAAMAVIPELPRIYDEPFADASQIPTLLVSRLARHSVTVALSGDGGDELFGGYSRYVVSQRWHRWLSSIPAGIRSQLGKLLGALGSTASRENLQSLSSADLGRWLSRDRMRDLSHQLRLRETKDVYRRFVSHWWSVEHLVASADEEPSFFTSPEDWPATRHFAEWMMFADAMTYLPDAVLTKVDRAAMSTSLETRVPFLDHRVVEFAWRLPMHLKVREGQGKWLPRQLLRTYLPDALIDRPKMGFGVPIGAWLRGPLRDWASELLNEQRLMREGYLNSTLTRHIWEEHLSGVRNWEYLLWNVLMLQSWLSHRDEDRHAPVVRRGVMEC